MYVYVFVCRPCFVIDTHFIFSCFVSWFFEVYSEDPEENSNLSARLYILKKKLEVVGFDTQMLKIGQHCHLMCPQVMFLISIYFFAAMLVVAPWLQQYIVFHVQNENNVHATIHKSGHDSSLAYRFKNDCFDLLAYFLIE